MAHRAHIWPLSAVLFEEVGGCSHKRQRVEFKGRSQVVLESHNAKDAAAASSCEYITASHEPGAGVRRHSTNIGRLGTPSVGQLVVKFFFPHLRPHT